MSKSTVDQSFVNTNLKWKSDYGFKYSTKPKHSVVKCLYFREILLTKSLHRHTLNILQRVYSSSNSKLTLKHKLQSNPGSVLVYTYGKVFAQASGTLKEVNCYSVYGCYSSKNSHNLPLLYSFPVLPKIEDFITYNGPVHQVNIKEKQTYRPCIFAVRTKSSSAGKESYLVQYDSETGEALLSVFLSDTWKYSEVIDDSESGRLVIKSSRHQFRGCENNPSINSDILLRLILFEYLPLQLVAAFPIRRSIFGRKINNVFVSQNLLLIYQDGNVIKIYSIEDIITQAHPVYLLGDRITNEDGSFVVGEAPIGIPTNVTLNEAPPCLFEIKTSAHELSIGGTPWLYVYSPRSKHYKVCDLKTGSPAEITLESDSKSFEPDFIGFHPLRAATLIQQSSTIFRTWDVYFNQSHQPSLQEAFVFSISPPEQRISSGFSRYGRKLSYQSSSSHTYDDLYDLAHDFEDEMDILGILLLQHCISQNQILVEKLLLFDSNYEKVNEFEIMELIDESTIISHVTLTLDLDIVAIKVRSSSKSTLLVFQLSGSQNLDMPSCNISCRSKRTRFIPSHPIMTRLYNNIHHKHIAN